MKIVKYDGTEHELQLLPQRVTDVTFFRPIVGLENTVADPDAKSILVGNYTFPVYGNKDYKETCKLIIGEPPIVSPAGIHECIAVRIHSKNAKGEITSFEFKLDGKRVFSSNKVVLQTLKEYLIPGTEFRLAKLGSLEKGKKTITIIDNGKMVELHPYLWRLNIIAELLNKGVEFDLELELNQVRADLAPLFERTFDKEVLNNHENLRITNVVLDSDQLGLNQVGFGVKFTKKLLRVVNRIRMKDPEALPVSAYDLQGLQLNVVVRYPADSPGNVLQGMVVVLLKDTTNAFYVHPETLLGANGDADGDTLSIEITKAVIEALNKKNTKEDISLIKAIPSITGIGTPVDKQGNILDIRTFTGVDKRQPVDVMVGQMSKHFTGLVTNGMNSLSIIARCLGTDPIERGRILAALDIEFSTIHRLDPMEYKKLITNEIKKSLIVVDEAIMDVWKEYHNGNESALLPELHQVMMFLSKDNYLFTDRMDSLTGFNWVMLNKIKSMAGGYNPTKSLLQWPIAGSVIGSSNTEEIISCVKKKGTSKMLEYLEGSSIEPRVFLKEEKAQGKQKDIPVIGYPQAAGDPGGFLMPWFTVQKYCPGVLIEEEGFDLKIKMNGQVLTVPNYRMTVDESKNMLIVQRGRSRRVSKLIGTVVNRNAGKMVNEGYELSEAIPEVRYETILDRFAYAIKEVSNEKDLSASETQILLSSRLKKAFEDYTDIINDADFEVNVHSQRVSIELIQISPLYLLEAAEYIANMMRDMVNPITGKPIFLHYGLGSKNKPGELAAIWSPTLMRSGKLEASLTCPIDLTAHICAGKDGVNEARFWKEAWTTRFSQRFIETQRLKDRICNGYEKLIPEIVERSKDCLVLIANMEGYLSYKGITSDKGLLTPEGQRFLAVVPRAKKTTGLSHDILTRVCETLTGESGSRAIEFAIKDGYTIVEDTRPLECRDKYTKEPLYEKVYTIIEPLDNSAPTWMKLYFSGYKGIFICINQDFEVNVNGILTKVHAIMDSRTFASKKMHAEFIAGALGLRGKRLIGDRPIFGTNNSLHEELLTKIEDEPETSDTGCLPILSNNEVIGEGLVAYFRTFVLKSDPEYMSIQDRGFKATTDIMSLTGRKYDISKSTINKLNNIAKVLF